jgi:hypothetical protein
VIVGLSFGYLAIPTMGPPIGLTFEAVDGSILMVGRKHSRILLAF